MSPRGEKLNQQMRKEAITKITKAALEVFAQYGYHGTTMNHIMKASGLSQGLVYYYFSSKKKVFFHLVECALKVSKNIWMEALNLPGTAWQKIERLSENLVKNAFTYENSLYYLIMLQAYTQGASIPGLSQYIMKHTAHYDLLPPLVSEAQKSGEAAQGDPEVLVSSYCAIFLGYTLILFLEKDLKKKITPETFTSVLRKKG